MEYELTTDRLGLRKWSPKDYPIFCRMNADPQVMQYFPSVLDDTESLHVIERFRDHFDQYGYGFFACDILDTQEFIGFIGFNHPRFESTFTPCLEIGWRLARDHWNRGYATEGARKCLEFGFNTLKEKAIYSFTATINRPSERVMQKIGMSYISNFDHPLVDPKSPLCEHLLYRITDKDIVPESRTL